MRREKRNNNKFNIFNLIKTIIFLLSIIFVFKIAPNYVRDVKEKETISLIINNNNVTSRLKEKLYMNSDNVIYMSIKDVKNYLDKYIYVDEKEKHIITTYGEKVSVLPFNEKKVIINNSSLEILSGIEVKDEIIYLPISELEKAYNMDMNYISEEKTLILDSLERELVTATASKNTKVKSIADVFSARVDKVEKGQNVVVIDEGGKWTKVRTSKGKIGYVKTSNLQNKYYVRKQLETATKTEKINLVWDYYSEYVDAPNRNGTTIEGINVVSPSFFSLISNGNGSIYNNIGTSGLNYINWSRKNNYKIWAMVSNNSYKDTTSKILNSYTLRTNLINNIVSLANQYNLDGINIDFENMNESDKDMFSRFIIELQPKLEESGKVLSVDVTAPDGGETWSMCYDRNVIGDVADYIVFMAYDQYGSSSPKEGTTAGYNWVETNLKKFIEREEIDSQKIILGIPFYTRLWKEQNGRITSQTVNIKDIDNVIPKNITRSWNDDLKQHYVEYTRNSATYKMWIEDETSIKEKVGLVRKYNLAGTAAWEKDRESANIWKIINESLNS